MDNHFKDASLYGHKDLTVFVKSLIPFFIRNEYPNFTKFITIFLKKFSEKGSGVELIQNMLYYANIDETSGQFLDKFCQAYLKDIQYLESIDKRTLVKWIRQWYEAIGSEQSYKFLFRVLYNKDVDFYYPTNDILRVSDGKWIQDRIIRITRSMLSEEDKKYYEDMVGAEIKGIGLDPYTPEDNFPSDAKALVERVRFIHISTDHDDNPRTVEKDYDVVELFVSDISLDHPIDDLMREEWIECKCLHIKDENGDPYTWMEKSYSMLVGFDIIEGAGGLYFEPGDKIKIMHPRGVEGYAIVNNITTGNFTGLEVIKPGKGYMVGDRVILEDGYGHGAYAYVTEIYSDQDIAYAQLAYDNMLIETGDSNIANLARDQKLIETGSHEEADKAYWESLKLTGNEQKASEAYNEAYRDPDNIAIAIEAKSIAILNGYTSSGAQKAYEDKLHELAQVKYDETLKNTGNVEIAKEAYQRKLKETGDEEAAYLVYIEKMKETGNKEAAQEAYDKAYNEKGGIKKLKMGSGGEGYRFFPHVVIDTKNGEGAMLYPHGTNVGMISEIKIINSGFDYTKLEWEEIVRCFNFIQEVEERQRGVISVVSNVPVPRDIILNNEGEQINKWYDKGRTRYPSRPGGFLVKDYIEGETIEYKGNIDFRSLTKASRRILEEAVDRKKIYTFPIRFTTEAWAERAITDSIITFYRDNTQGTSNLIKNELIQCFDTSNQVVIQGRINRIDNERGIMSVTMLKDMTFSPGMIVQGSETNSRGNVILNIYNTQMLIKTGSNIKTSGYYNNQDGWSSSGKKLQDSYYYQDFSYVLKSDVPQEKWDKDVHNTVHPAGSIVFGIGSKESYTYGPSYGGHEINTEPLSDSQNGSVILIEQDVQGVMTSKIIKNTALYEI